MGDTLIVLAGATGNLGGRVADALLERGARVRALIRHESTPAEVEQLRDHGATIARVDFNDPAGLAQACGGAACVVSTLSGLREVIVDAQTMLLDAAIEAGVPRFIPSDYAIDFTRLPPASNRNLDLRRDFHERLNGAKIAATSVLNGMFTDMLSGQAPIILFTLKRVVYWEDADQPMDFTTIDDTAEFTAAAALDPSTPRFLRVAGDRISARGLATVASEVTGERFRLLRAGGLSRLGKLIKIMRAVFPGRGDLYPPWQGMQYLHNMFSGRAILESLDNDRYSGLRWTTVRDVLAAAERRESSA